MIQDTYILDCNGLCWAAYHTIGGLSFDDVATGVIYGFLNKVHSIWKRHRPARFVFAWDSSCSIRRMMYPDYKSNRHGDLLPEEAERRSKAREQMFHLHEKILPTIGFRNSYRVTGYEADDVIAVMAQKLGTCCIVSTDKDLLQCLEVGCTMLNPISGLLTTMADFQKEYGIPPSTWAEVKGVAGCPSDNVVGVRGVGVSTACKFFRGDLKGKKKDLIIEFMASEEYKRNLRLVRLPMQGIRTKVLKMIEPDVWDDDGFLSICTEFGMPSLIDHHNDWRALLNEGAVQ